MSAEKTNSQAGFSLIEMTIVLAILAIGATTAMSVVNNRLEEAVTTRTVADLRVVAEAAYECYVAGDCKDAENGGWASSITTATGGVSANTILGDLGDYLPVGLSDRYKFEVLSPNEDGFVKRAKVRVDMEDNARASRVARRFGSAASVSRSGQAAFVTLGVPGTEQAFIAAGDKIKNDIKNEDFVFGTPPAGGSKSNIAGAGDISADSISVGSATIGEQAVATLQTLAGGLNCPWGIGVNSEGEVSCAKVRKQCHYRDENLYSGEQSKRTWATSWRTLWRVPANHCYSGSKYGASRHGYRGEHERTVKSWRCDSDGNSQVFTVRTERESFSRSPGGC